MYPKLSRRKTADGEPIYTYVCKMKERSKRERCNRRNANGNILDAAIIEQIKTLTEHDSSVITQLEKCRQLYTGNREQYESQLADLRAEYAENEKIINGLNDSLGMVGDSIAKPCVLKCIEELTQINREIESRILKLEGLTTAKSLSDLEFDPLRQMRFIFRTSIDEMTISKLLLACVEKDSATICHSMNEYVQFSVSGQRASYIDRNTTIALQSPEAHRLSLMNEVFAQAARLRHPLTETCCTMLLHNLGYGINFIEGGMNNIKIVREEDIAAFSVMIK